MLPSNKFGAQKLRPCIQIKTVTWIKDSHGLFDYESRHLNMKKFISEKPCYIWKKENEIFFDDQPIKQQDPTTPSENNKMLAQLNLNYIKNSTSIADSFSLNPNEEENKEIYLIVRSLKNKDGTQKGYNIEPGDMIKLGRIEFKLLETRDNEYVKSIIEETEYTYSLPSKKEKTKKTCRICLGDDEPVDEDTLYVNLCKCKGSCEFVHIVCLKNWIQSKIKTKVSGPSVLYKLKKLECEVCKEPLPSVLKIKDKKIPIFHIERPECPYMILQGFSKEKTNSKELYLIPILSEEPIKLGRGHLCDIRSSDISVSRLHAFINFENGKFFLKDNSSKFGTLVLLNHSINISEEKIAVQIGRTVLTFALKYIQTETTNLPKLTGKFNNKQMNKKASTTNYGEKNPFFQKTKLDLLYD